MKKPDVFYVLAEAVEAYKAAAFRDRHGYARRGYTAKQVAKEFPKYFTLHSTGKIKFIGKMMARWRQLTLINPKEKTKFTMTGVQEKCILEKNLKESQTKMIN
mgnify:CR=1 FL=1